MTLQDELEVAKELAVSAGKSVCSLSPKKLQRKPGSRPGRVATIPDLIADDIILAGLRQAFPHDALSSEQTPVSSTRFECDRLWLIDALDGATDLVEHGDEYTVSIGLAVRGHAVLGVVYNPLRDELFAGTTAQPTTINGLPVCPSTKDEFDGARIGVPCSEWAYSNKGLPAWQAARPTASTSYQLARVAAGMDDGFFSVMPVREWSTCAGVALVGAAGGRATLQGAQDIGYNNSNLTHPLGIIAAGCNLHKLLNQVQPSLPGGRMRQ